MLHRTIVEFIRLVPPGPPCSQLGGTGFHPTATGKLGL